MNVLLVRHGETAWNREGRYQGRTDVPLSVDGEAQARALAARLANIPIAFAIASPLSRARNTAEAVLVGRGLELELDDRLVEIGHGAWEGKLASDAETADAAMFKTWRTAPSADFAAGPGGESLGEVRARAWPVLVAACDRLRGDETALIAAHDAVNRVLLCQLLGLPLERVWTFRQAPATLNALSGSGLSDLQVVRLNDSEHVAPLLQEARHRAL